MNTQKILIGALIGAITLFVIGYIIYVLIMPSPAFAQGDCYGDCATDPAAIIFPAIIVMEILWALLVAVIFGRWASISTFNTGMKAGAFIGLIIGLGIGLDIFATTCLITFNAVIFYGITYAIRYAIAGGVIGWYFGRP